MRNRTRNFSKRELFYGSMVVLLIIGICLGALFANYTNTIQTQELLQYMDQFFNQFSIQKVPQNILLKDVLWDHGKIFGVLWILGFTIIGIPFIFIFVFLKGFTYGFTSAFLFKQYGWDGFLFTIISCLPQNLVLIPGLIFISGSGVRFALINHKNRQKHFKERKKYWGEYGIIFLIGLICILLAGIIETYISPFFMKIMVSHMINK